MRKLALLLAFVLALGLAGSAVAADVTFSTLAALRTDDATFTNHLTSGLKATGNSDVLISIAANGGADVLALGDLQRVKNEIARLFSTNVNYDATCRYSLTIAVEDQVTIPAGAFDGDNYLKKVDFTGSTNLTTIEANAFANTPNLAALTLESDIEEIGERAFYNTGPIGDLDFSAGGSNKLKKIKKEAFAASTKVGNTAVTWSNILTEIGEGAFRSTGLKTITLASLNSTLTTIGDGAFRNITTLHNGSGAAVVVLPTGLVNLGKEAFAGVNYDKITGGCTGLTIDLSSLAALKDHAIPEGAFKNSGFTAIDIGGIETIGKEAFAGITSDPVFTLGTAIKDIKDGAFKGSKLGALDFSPCTQLATIGKEAFAGVTKNSSFTVNLSSTKVTEIPERAFAGSELRNIDLPLTLETIGAYAFSNTKELDSIKVNTGAEGNLSTSALTTIGSYAFTDSLYKSPSVAGELTFPASLNKLEEYAFYRARQIKRLVFNGAAVNGSLAEFNASLPEIGPGALALMYENLAICFNGEDDTDKLSNVLIGLDYVEDASDPGTVGLINILAKAGFTSPKIEDLTGFAFTLVAEIFDAWEQSNKPVITASRSAFTVMIGDEFSYDGLEATGAATITWEISKDPELSWLRISAESGELRGSPDALAEVGTFNFTVRARNSMGYSQTLPFTIEVTSGAPSINGPFNLPATVGKNFDYTLTAIGVAPITWEILHKSPELGWLIINRQTGALSNNGYPTEIGTFNFTVLAENPKDETEATFTVTVTSGSEQPKMTAYDLGVLIGQASELRDDIKIGSAVGEFPSEDKANEAIADLQIAIDAAWRAYDAALLSGGDTTDACAALTKAMDKFEGLKNHGTGYSSGGNPSKSSGGCAAGFAPIAALFVLGALKLRKGR